MRSTCTIRSVLLIVCFPLLAATVHAAPEFDVDELAGIAKVQQSGKEEWENVKKGRNIVNGDIIETFFKSRIVLQLARRTVVIAGPNSKILCEMVEKRDQSGDYVEVSINLLSGGVFVKSTERDPITVFTSTGTIRTGKGAISAIVEPKTGETGFQVLEGQAEARNISQHQTRALTAGQTTLIEPGREASPPLYITYRHVSVLKSFFGDEYIANQLSSAGIKPTDERALSSQMKLSEPRAAAEAPSKSPSPVEGSYKRPFSMEKIYGSILSDEERENPQYREVQPARKATPGRFEVAAGGGSAVALGENFGGFLLSPSFYRPNWSVGIRFTGERTSDGFGLHQGNGATSGLLDVIDHARFTLIGQDRFRSLELWAGPLNDLSFGEGILVHHLDNRNPYFHFQPLGLRATGRHSYFLLDAFMSDVSLRDLGGVNVAWEPGSYHFGASYYYDSGTLRRPDDRRRTRFLDPAPGGFVEASNGIHSYELGFSTDLSTDRYRTVELSAGWSQTLIDSGGFILKAPGLRIAMKGMDFGANLVFQQGKSLYHAMHWFYPVNRYVLDSTGYRYQTDFMPGRRLSGGLDLFYKVKLPWNISVDANYFQEMTSVFYEKVRLSSDTVATRDSVRDSTLGHPFSRNFAYRFDVVMGDSVVPGIQYARVYVAHDHAGLIPFKSPYFIPSWGFILGAQAVSRPLIAGVAAEGSLRFYYLDIADPDGRRGANGILNPGTDHVFEYYLGVRWGFL